MMVSRVGRVHAVGLGALCAAFAAGGGAQAQSQPQSQAEGAPAVAEVIVTATRREERLQDVPISITAVSEQTLKNLGARDKVDFLYTVPGVSFSDIGGGRESYAVRGIGELGSSPTVAIYIDETPIPQGGSFKFDLRLFDIDQIEVLRGPQGTLYGASAMGGAIRTLTHKPDFDRFGGAVDATVSTTNRGGTNYDGNLAVNFPLSDRFAVRVVGFRERESGYIDNVKLGEDANGDPVPGAVVERNVGERVTEGGRVVARLKATDRLTLTANYYVQNDRFAGLNSEDTLFGAGSFLQARAFDERQRQRNNLANLTGTLDLGFAKVVSATSYAWARSFEDNDFTRNFGGSVQFLNELLGDGRPTDTVTPLSVNQTSEETSLSQELRIASSGTGKLRWLLGGFYQRTRLKGVQLFSAPNSSDFFGELAADDNLFRYYPKSSTEEFSVFAEGSYQFTPLLGVTLGLRRYDFRSRFASLTSGVFNYGGDLTDVDPGTRDSGGAQEDGLTYKAVVTLKPTSNFLFFAGATSGYRPGASNGTLPAGQNPTPVAQFQSDELWQYEAGWKTSFWNRRLTFDGSIYYIRWTDIQTAVFTDAGFQFIANVGKAHSSGAEVEIAANPFKGLNIEANAAYTDGRFDSDLESSGVLKGAPLPQIPEYTANVSFDYSRPLTDRLTGFVFADMNHVGRRYANANQGIKLGAYDTVTLRTGVRWNGAELSLSANNLLDARGLAGREDSNAGIRRIYIRPRTVGLSLRADF